jgi:SAM-dependent methyltransferase
MTDDTRAGHRFYGDLAMWWPLVSAPAEYAEEAAFAASLLDSADGPTRTVLELGSGGGNNAFHLKARYAMTLVDLSEAMLAVSRELNPECEHLQGDMRDLRLGRTFDAVFVHDAIEYMTTEEDLRRAVETAYVHCRPGGVAVLVPDDITENYAPVTEHGGNDAPDGRAVRYLSWSVDPDPTDTTTRTDYAFLLREADGTVSIAHDTHVLGLFPRELWLRVLTDAGFRARVVAEVTSEDRLPREFFVGFRPNVP